MTVALRRRFADQRRSIPSLRVASDGLLPGLLEPSLTFHDGLDRPAVMKRGGAAARRRLALHEPRSVRVASDCLLPGLLEPSLTFHDGLDRLAVMKRGGVAARRRITLHEHRSVRNRTRHLVARLDNGVRGVLG